MKKNLLLTILVIIVGTLLLRIFIPWWIISLLMGVITVLTIYVWVADNTPVPEPWTKKILLIVSTIFVISLTLSFVGQKWPWVDKAFDDRQFYSSLAATDLVDPKYPDVLARSIYQTERMKIRAEENQLQALLAVTQQKLTNGIPLTATDEAIVKRAKERLTALDKELSEVNLARQKTETNDKKPIDSRTWKLLFFGAILLMSGWFISKKTSWKKIAGSLALIGVVAMVLGLGGLFFSQEVQAVLTKSDSDKKPPAITHHAPTAAPQLPANAKFVKVLAPGERVYLTRTSMDAPPPERWARNVRGEVYKVVDWPPDEKTFYTENTWPDKAEIFIVLPSGQGYTASATDPTLGKQVARASLAPTASAAHAKAHINVTPADPFNGKYRWDGRIGYPEDR